MPTKLKTAILAAAALGVAAAPTLADEAAEKAIGARKAQMQLIAFNLGQLGAMAKGEVDYDAEAASAAAGNVAALAGMHAGAMWPQGTDSTAMPGKTRAKVEAWTTWPKISEANAAFVKASAEFATVAGGGLDALRGGIGEVGKTCGGCHKPFREEE